MPDISLCRDESCPSRLSCYRFTAKASEYQSYMDFERPEGNEKCRSYIEARSKSQVSRLDAQTEGK